MLAKIFVSVGVILIFCTGSKGFISSRAKKVGCYHNGTFYADESLVPTLEPCLNCRCMNKTLICSLRICPEMPIPPPRGCILIHKKNTCCPYLSCSKFHNLPNELNRKIIMYLNHLEKETLDRIVNENALRRRSDDFELDGPDEICIQNGTVYKSGSAMSSSSLCSYCYCIGGTQKCVKPKCLLSMKGCKPIFVDSACCPVRYDCALSKSSSNIMKSQNHARKAGNKHYQRMRQRLQRSRGCTISTVFYSEGQKIPSPSDKPCDICFCIRGVRKCAPKKCAPSIRNCLPVIPKGQCCPSSYDCGYVKDIDRAFKSRQFDLFSLLFGADDEQDVNINSTTISPLPSSSSSLSEIQLYDYQKHNDGILTTSIPLFSPLPALKSSSGIISTTSERSIFDAIREGLEYIDNNQKFMDDLDIKFLAENSTSNSSQIHENEEKIVKLNANDTSLTKNHTSPVSTLDELDDETLSIFDLLVDSSNTENRKNFTSSVIMGDLLEDDSTSINTVNYTKTSSTTDMVDTSPSDNLKTDGDTTNNYYSTPVAISYESTQQSQEETEEESNSETLSTTYSYETTTETVLSETSTLPFALEESTTTEYSHTSSLLPLTTELHELETRKPNSTESDQHESRTEVFTSIMESSTATPHINQTAAKTEVTTNNSNPITLEKKPEKDFLSVLFNELSTILQDNYTNGNFSSKNSTRVKIQVPSTTVKSTTIKYPSSTSVYFYQKLNTSHASTLAPKIPINTGTVYAIPIHSVHTLHHFNMKERPKPSSSIIKSKPSTVIKNKPSILGGTSSDYNFDYNLPTLPPSLPNLKIIPFLPTDAVKNDRKQTTFTYYNPAPITERLTNDWKISPAQIVLPATPNPLKIPSYDYRFENYARFPSITANIPEKYINYGTLNKKGYDHVYDDYEYPDFNVPDEYPPIRTVSTSNVENIKFVNKYPDPIKKFDMGIMNFEGMPPYKSSIDNKNNMPGYSLQVNSGFSPPTKTEGGFVPKEPIRDELYYENMHTTKFHVDFTTSVPNIKLNTSSPLNEIKELIKISPEDGLLANELIPDDTFEKGIISITTDSPIENPTFECNDTFSNCSVNMIKPENINGSPTSTNVTPMNVTTEQNTSELIVSSFTTKNTSEEMSDIEFGSAIENLFNLFGNGNTASTNKTFTETVNILPAVTERTTQHYYKSHPTKVKIKIKEITTTTTQKPEEDLSFLKDALLSSFGQSNPESTLMDSKSPQYVVNDNPPIKENVFIAEPFNKLPFMRPSYPVKQSDLNSAHNFDLIFPNFEKNPNKQITHHVLSEGPIISNTESYVVNPVDIDKLKEHTIVRAEIFTKPESFSNKIKDPAGILKLAGCNIYGRMYRVGRIISELSGPCLECKCTEVGVSCTPLTC